MFLKHAVQKQTEAFKKKYRVVNIDKDMRLFKFRRNSTRLLKQSVCLCAFILASYVLRIFYFQVWVASNSSSNGNNSNVFVFGEATVKSLLIEDVMLGNEVSESFPLLRNDSKEPEKVFAVYSPVNPPIQPEVKPNDPSHSLAEQNIQQNGQPKRLHFPVNLPEGTSVDRSNYPSLYNAYSEGQVKSGLSYSGRTFTLNGINIRILSGSINYFRVHPHYWKDRLKKLRALGFNTIETYVPWNIHEQRAGQYNFTEGWMNLRKFIQTAREEDLLVILRPGPYICSQWDYGGLPSFLLRNDVITYRSADPAFLVPAKKYLKALSRDIVDLQWSQKYGAQPLIMIQVENDFSIDSSHLKRDHEYILELKKAMEEEGLTHVQYVVNNKINFIGKEKLVPGVLQAITIPNAAPHALSLLNITQPDKPLMVMEYWTGMYDRWFDRKLERGATTVFMRNFLEIMMVGASVNLYMFHGGSNFGFLGGGSHTRNETIPRPTTSSFDFDAPVTESGNYTKKYWMLRRAVASIPPVLPYRVDEPPKLKPTREYAISKINYYIPFEDMIESLPVSVYQRSPRNMEALNINQGNGQGYGFILYRKTWLKLNPGDILKVAGIVRDILYLIIDGKMITKPIRDRTQLTEHGYWASRNPEFALPGDGETHQLDLLVENFARFDSRDLGNQRKGIRGSVYVNDELVTDWQVYPLEFKKTWIQNNDKWRAYKPGLPIHAPALFKGTLMIEQKDIHDTFINTMEEGSQWTKGQVFINGFNLGRYWNVGPTNTLYVPAPLLKKGKNEIIFFELFQPGNFIHFEETPV